MKNIYLGLKNFERGFMGNGRGGKLLAYPCFIFYSDHQTLCAAATCTRSAASQPGCERVQRLSTTVPPQLGKSSNQSHSFGICLL